MIALVGAPALQADAAVIPEGIYAGERSLGGMEEDAALTAVEEYGDRTSRSADHHGCEWCGCSDYGSGAGFFLVKQGSGEGRSGRIYLWQCDPSLF